MSLFSRNTSWGALAIATALTIATTPAVRADSQTDAELERYQHPSGLQTGYTSAMLATAKGEQQAALLRYSWNLQPGWTERDYCAAKAGGMMKGFRATYNLGPGFTGENFRENAGAREVNGLANSFHLDAHFTEAQLVHAGGLSEASWTLTRLGLQGELPIPFSAEQLQHASGIKAIKDLASKFQLGADFTYAQLKASAGPQATATVRHDYKFAYGADSSEMREKAGLFIVAKFASENDLNVDFTAADMMAAMERRWSDNKRQELKNYLPAGAPLTQENLLKAYGDKRVGELHKGMGLEEYDFGSHWSITGPIDEAAVSGAAQSICTDLRTMYALKAGFTEGDYIKAYGASEVADLQQRYHLHGSFIDSQLLDAIRMDGFRKSLKR